MAGSTEEWATLLVLAFADGATLERETDPRGDESTWGWRLTLSNGSSTFWYDAHAERDFFGAKCLPEFDEDAANSIRTLFGIK